MVKTLRVQMFVCKQSDSFRFSCMNIPRIVAMFMPRCLHSCLWSCSTVCVHVRFHVTAGMLEKVKHKQPAGRVLPGLCGRLWSHITRSAAGWGLEDAALNGSAGSHTGPTLKMTVYLRWAGVVWTRGAFAHLFQLDGVLLVCDCC